jgi:hypothetical protein
LFGVLKSTLVFIYPILSFSFTPDLLYYHFIWCSQIHTRFHIPYFIFFFYIWSAFLKGWVEFTETSRRAEYN